MNILYQKRRFFQEEKNKFKFQNSNIKSIRLMADK